eukprot:Filipodium_phascolosomae@DN5196_c0_g1_i1.p1
MAQADSSSTVPPDEQRQFFLRMEKMQLVFQAGMEQRLKDMTENNVDLAQEVKEVRKHIENLTNNLTPPEENKATAQAPPIVERELTPIEKDIEAKKIVKMVHLPKGKLHKKTEYCLTDQESLLNTKAVLDQEEANELRRNVENTLDSLNTVKLRMIDELSAVKQFAEEAKSTKLA